MSERQPALVLCANGTRDLGAAATVRRLARKVARTRPGIDVIRAYADIQSPHVGDLAASLAMAGRTAVIVPVLLCTGAGVGESIASVVRRHRVVAAEPLGPDPALAQLVVDRLRAAGAADGDGVVLVTGVNRTGSAREAANAAVELVRARWVGPVELAFGRDDAQPALAVRHMRERVSNVAIAAYVLGRGRLYRSWRSAGADYLSAPLGSDDLLVELILQRFDSARSRSAPLSSVAAATSTRTSSSA
ncbi:sirohydrochlorin chelatase [Blastococcus sp. Marseille-P5729]|uniref:sirohydrochlorin chelatase n=1 Tax=Blastococcus sp. Marseille-P5729 TaxID=2086582 RepID=UPI00131E2C4D|nr:CbiX/SirB N-terminal domain-containing protein [Blastococcus sp. Marseille-P5729]